MNPKVAKAIGWHVRFDGVQFHLEAPTGARIATAPTEAQAWKQTPYDLYTLMRGAREHGVTAVKFLFHDTIIYEVIVTMGERRERGRDIDPTEAFVDAFALLLTDQWFITDAFRQYIEHTPIIKPRDGIPPRIQYTAERSDVAFRLELPLGKSKQPPAALEQATLKVEASLPGWGIEAHRVKHDLGIYYAAMFVVAPDTFIEKIRK